MRKAYSPQACRVMSSPLSTGAGPLAFDGFSFDLPVHIHAHATFQRIEKLKLSLQPIMGATEKR